MGYTIGKFGWGIVADSISPRLLFATGLFVSAVFNVICSYVSTDYFVYLWLCNGIMQGTGWPACAKLANRYVICNIWESTQTRDRRDRMFRTFTLHVHLCHSGLRSQIPITTL